MDNSSALRQEEKIDGRKVGQEKKLKTTQKTKIIERNFRRIKWKNVPDSIIKIIIKTLISTKLIYQFNIILV